MGVESALLDVDELAEFLNVSVRHVRRLVFERRVPFLKIGSRVRFEPEAVAVWLSTLRVDACASTKGLAAAAPARPRSSLGARDRTVMSLGRLPSRAGRDGPAWRGERHADP
jgi:excisionase family DNA binding protein